MAMAAHRAVGAVVAALLSAVTEPVVNNMLVERLSLMEAVKTLDPMKITKFLQITLATNFMNILKNNIFASNCQYQKTKLSSSDRKTGCVGIDFFCDPAGHRFRKSMNVMNLPTSKNL